MRSSPGFTLIELLVTVAVLAVLAGIAAPNYRVFVQTQKVRQASYDLMSSLLFARSEAIKRNTSVSITKAASGWTQGWTISAGGVSLRTQDPYLSGIDIANSASLATVTYSNEGRVAGASSTFKIASTDSTGQVSPRCVTIQLGGMPTSKVGGC